MRHSTLFLSICMAGALGAQPILQYGNVNLVGSNYDLYVVTDPGNSNPGVNGANVTWDFSSAVMVLAGTNSFVAPAGTPYAASFPASNLAAVVTHQDTTGYMYYSVSSSQLEILAEYVGTNDENVYTVPKSVLEFPFAFNDSFQDDYVDEDASNTVTRTYTGYGTVILPGGGTVADVVKTTSTSGSMAFFRSNPVAPLVSIEDDGDAVWWMPAGVGLPELAASPLHAWPNPVSDALQLRSEPGDQWSVLDVQGRALLSGRATTTLNTIDMAGLSTGHYVLRVANAAGVRAVPVIKQ
ncbi:MAG: T9SS type A sorting domain-containing protein [Bacteroidetes bacterium]|jgi:hypothetical protein|nr:T9SS type A sorting domain-containing protein [Bacteroidota bacterium]MBX7130486.1 T9SS type A sorting domain-containing protein [Flavobacteriales bacterium]MCC6655464.1 T9SS type A sorting domain-containing protein [Flavobacteriales bacterium]HMU13583.1 T9SS type A sorting domain-containing protein [Flavobacteriales bacterium]HMZ48013.1 T9SS type A sorting domain-containing protein [Flavobacteriales bacterium]